MPHQSSWVPLALRRNWTGSLCGVLLVYSIYVATFSTSSPDLDVASLTGPLTLFGACVLAHITTAVVVTIYRYGGDRVPIYEARASVVAACRRQEGSTVKVLDLSLWILGAR